MFLFVCYFECLKEKLVLRGDREPWGPAYHRVIGAPIDKLVTVSIKIRRKKLREELLISLHSANMGHKLRT